MLSQLFSINPLIFATHNIRFISNTLKYNQFLNTMTSFNIDFCELTKTYHNTGHKYKTAHYSLYTAFWSVHPNCHAGVGLVLHRKWYIFVQYVFLQHDHFLYVNLFLKGDIKLRIIITYLHAHLLDKTYRTHLQHQLCDLISSSLTSSYHIVIIGDFNINLNKLYTPSATLSATA